MTKESVPHRRLFQLVAMITVAGCAPSTAPATSGDVYFLQNIDGRSLPTSTTSAPNANGVTILSEELSLDHNGTATRSTRLRTAPSTSQLITVQFAYTLVNGVVTLGDQLCAPNALCAIHAPEQGRLTDGMLSLTALGPVGASSPVFQYRLSLPID